ncbi:MAG: DNA polymerase subunit beta, partial [Methanobrevibacter sp.]|nr:DNA polymerase subunit beta [Methanobrevibacter sp.]
MIEKSRNVRTRDFIHTTDDLFFASTNYLHPKDRFISFLRYIPDENGDREKNGQRYSKVTSEEAYRYLHENYPEYLYFCNISNVEMMGVPHSKVKSIIKPEERLEEIRENSSDISTNNPLITKLLKLADFFHYCGGIARENLGISGSILPNLEQESISDLDFVIYGLENHRKAMELFKKFQNKEVQIPKSKTNVMLKAIEDSYWEKIFNKRMKDSSLSKKEFCWYESRKYNRGVIDGTLFDILATRNPEEIHGKWGDTKYEPIGIATIEATVKNAIASFDNPAIYEISDLAIVKSDFENNYNITEIASFTHTYAGQAIEGEEIIAKGKVEKVIKDGCKNSYRLVVGTTRESIDEFIKLK